MKHADISNIAKLLLNGNKQSLLDRLRRDVRELNDKKNKNKTDKNKTGLPTTYAGWMERSVQYDRVTDNSNILSKLIGREYCVMINWEEGTVYIEPYKGDQQY